MSKTQTKADLQKMCDELGIKYKHSYNKAKLEELIEQARERVADPEPELELRERVADPEPELEIRDPEPERTPSLSTECELELREKPQICYSSDVYFETDIKGTHKPSEDRKITHETIAKWLRENPKTSFLEIVPLSMVRPYFDIEFKKGEIDEKTIPERLGKINAFLKGCSFGAFSIWGYMSKEFKGIDGGLIHPNSKKHLSLHVVFPDAQCEPKYLRDFIKSQNKAELDFMGIDTSVYRNGTSVFRFIGTPKWNDPECDSVGAPIKSFMGNDDVQYCSPIKSNQLITPCGNEDVCLTEDDFEVVEGSSSPIYEPSDSYVITPNERLQLLRDNIDTLDMCHANTGKTKLFNLLGGLYDATNEALDGFKDFLIEHQKITTKACGNWDDVIEKHRGERLNPVGFFVNVLKNNSIPIPRFKRQGLTIDQRIPFSVFIEKWNAISGSYAKRLSAGDNKHNLEEALGKAEREDDEQKVRDIQYKLEAFNVPPEIFKLLRKSLAIVRPDVGHTYIATWMENKTWSITSFESASNSLKHFKGFGTSLFNIVSDTRMSASFTYNDIAFHDENPRHLQIWNKWAANMLPSVDMEKIALTVEFIREVFCSNDDTIYNYFMGWVRYILENVGALTQKAFVLLSQQGTGKTTLCENILMPLFGKDFALSTSRLNSVMGEKNALRENKVFIFVDELVNDDNDRNQAITRGDWDKLKAAITDDSYDLRKMYHDSVSRKNTSNYIFATNHGGAISLDDSDRRYCILDVSDKHIGDVEFWKRLYAEIQTEGYHDALYTYIMTTESFKNGFNVGAPVIETNARKTLMAGNISQIKAFLLSPDVIPECGYIKKNELDKFYAAFRNYAIEEGTPEKYILTKNRFKCSLCNFFEVVRGRYMPNNKLTDELEKALESESEEANATPELDTWEDITIPTERFNIDEFIKEHASKLTMNEGKTEKQIRQRFVYYLTRNDYSFEKDSHTKQKVVAYKE